MSDDEELLHSFKITHVLDCIADPAKNRVIAEFSNHVDAVFPYLNAVMPHLLYNPGASTVTVKRGERILTFYTHMAVMAKVEGVEDATVQLVWFRMLCNDTWRCRDEIVPCYERRRLLTPLDAYWLLPKLNCKECGEATCMAFGVGLLLSNRRTSEWPHLREKAFAEGGRRLAELLG